MVPQAGLNDKLRHAAAYAGLIALGGMACASWRRRIVLAIGLLCYGGLLETVQVALPHREASLGDLTANAAGLGLGLLAVAVWCRILSRAEALDVAPTRSDTETGGP